MYSRRVRLLVLQALVLATLGVLLAACGTEAPTPTPTTGPGATGPTPTEPEPTATPDTSFDAASYFRGRTIRLITSSNPGGGTDILLRYYAGNWGEFIPGNPRITVSNIAPHVTGKNFLWNSKPDGFTVGLFSTSIIREQGLSEAEFTSSEFEYIGDVGDRTSLITLYTLDLPYRTYEDIQGSDGPPIKYLDQIPSPEDMNTQALQVMLLCHWLDFPCDFGVIGERGTSITLTEMERGNMDVMVGGGGRWFGLPQLRPGWVADGTLTPIIDVTAFGRFSPNAEFTGSVEDVPHIYDLLEQEQKEIWQGSIDAATAMSKPFALPPDTPDHIVAVYRKAFADALNDDEFKAGVERVSGIPATFVNGEDLQAEAAEAERVWMQWNEEQARLRQEMFDKYMR